MPYALTEANAETIAEVIERRGRQDGDFAFFTDGRALSGDEHFAAARRVASHIESCHGLGRGARVAVMAPTGPNLLAALSGCWYAGMLVAPLDIKMPFPALRQTLAQLRPDLILISGSVDTDGALASAATEWGYRLDDPDQQTEWPEGGIVSQARPNDPALVIFTSGSTGVPKGVVLSQANLLVGARNVTTAKGLTPADRAMCVLPLSHLNGLMTTYVAPLASGGAVVFSLGLFDSRKVLHEIDRYGCTWLSCVPTQYAAFMRPPVPASEWSLKTLRFCRSASASLRPQLRREFEAHYGIPIIETMGMTETSAQVFSNPMPPEPRRDGSVGKVIGFDVRIVADDGTILPDDAEGEIQFRGPGLMLGYLDDPEETARSYDGDWLRSGDLGRRDPEGYYYITGRKKEIAIFSGLNISLRALETAVLDEKLVDDISCVGEADPYFGERIAAYITTSAREPAFADLVERVGRVLEGQLPNRQALKEIRVVDSLPRTAVGKIRRYKLEELHVRYSSRPTLPTEPRPLLAEILGIAEQDVVDELALGSIRQWDSLAHAALVVATEWVLNRELEQHEILALTTFRGLAHVLEGTLPENEAVPTATEAEENPDLLALMVWNRKLPTARSDVESESHGSQSGTLLTGAALRQALVAAGLEAGDLVMVHSDIAALGLTEAGFNREAILDFYLSCIREVLTDSGTLFVCTSFEDYGRYATPFVREESPSRLGAFSEFIRTQPGAVRSLHPIVSVTGLGPAAEEICGGAHYDGFGYDSPWGRLHRANAKLMTLGMWGYPEMGLTFLHYIEQLHGVPYQYNKIFNAPVYADGQQVPGPFTMSVRYLDFAITYDTNGFRDRLVATGVGRRVPLASDAAFLVEANQIVDAGVAYLRENRYGLLQSAPNFRPGEIPMDGKTGEFRHVYDEIRETGS